MDTSVMNVLITGGTTGAGREATRQLSARGYRVVALTNGSDGAALVRQDGGVPAFADPLRAGEIKSLLRMGETEAVIHVSPTAGYGFPSRAVDYEEAARMTNQGTAALVDAARETGVKFLVHISPAAIYGDRHGEWVTEDSAPALEAEKLALESGLAACALRVGFVYGPEDEGLKALGEAIRHGRSVYVGDPHHYQNWIHYADLASAVVRVVEQKPAGQIFNIADDEPCSAATFAGLVADGIGLPAPEGMAGFTTRLMTSERQRALLAGSVRLNNTRAKSVLGWAPRYPTLKSGIDQTLLSWRAVEPAHR